MRCVLAASVRHDSTDEDDTVSKPKVKPAPELIAAMVKVYDGADVYDHHTASILRTVEREYPELIDICKAKNPPSDGAKQQPYFGAILTDKGAQIVLRATRSQR
jgi:hypothetical protein